MTTPFTVSDILERQLRGIGVGQRHLVRLMAMSSSRVLGTDTTLKTTDGAALTTAQYEIDLAAGDVLIGGVYGRFAALNDQPILGTDNWGKSFDLTGLPAAVIAADNFDYRVAIVTVLKDGVPTLYAIVGDVAATGGAVHPTAAQIRTALGDSGVSGLNLNCGVVLGRITYARAGAAVVATHIDPATAGTGDALKAERSWGTLVPDVD